MSVEDADDARRRAMPRCQLFTQRAERVRGGVAARVAMLPCALPRLTAAILFLSFACRRRHEPPPFAWSRLILHPFMPDCHLSVASPAAPRRLSLDAAERAASRATASEMSPRHAYNRPMFYRQERE